MPHAQYARTSKANHSIRGLRSSRDGTSEEIDDDMLEFFECEAMHASHTTPNRSDASAIDASETNGSISASVQRFARHFGTFGDWNYEGGDIVPAVLARLPGWVASGVKLEIVQDGVETQTFCPDTVSGGSPHAASVITVRRINDSHYVPIVDGRAVDQGADGNCLFYSIWYALDRCVPEETRRALYQGEPPNDKFSATRYFRAKGARHILDSHSYFADFLQAIPTAEEGEDIWFDAAEYPEGAEATSGISSETGQERFASDQTQNFVGSAILSPPFSLNEIAKAGLVLIGSIAAQKIISPLISMVGGALPYALSSAIAIGYYIYQALSELKNGSHIEAFFNFILAIPFELLSEMTLVRMISDRVFGAIYEHLPWLPTVMVTLNFPVEMDVANTLGLVLVAFLCKKYIEKEVSIQPGSPADYLIRLVNRLRKISSIYLSIEASLMAFIPGRDVSDLKSSRSGVPSQKYAPHADGDYEEARSNSTVKNIQPNTLDEYLGCSITPYAEADGDYTIESNLAETGDITEDQTRLQGESGRYSEAQKSATSVAADESRALLPLVAVAATWSTMLAVASDVFSERGYEIASYGAILTVGATLGWLFYKWWFSEVEQGQQALYELFEASESRGSLENYDPIQWKFDELSLATVLPSIPEEDVPERFQRRNLLSAEPDQKPVSSEILSKDNATAEIWKKFAKNWTTKDKMIILHEIGRLDKKYIDDCLTSFTSSDIFDIAHMSQSEDYGGNMMAAWDVLTAALRSTGGTRLFGEATHGARVDDKALFIKLKDRKSEYWGEIYKILLEMSSEDYFGKTLLSALISGENYVLRSVIQKIIAFEILRSKFIGGYQSFPYIEKIFGLPIPEVHVVDLPKFLWELESGSWNLKNVTGDVVSDAAMAGIKIFSDIFEAGISNKTASPSEMLEKLTDDNGAIQNRLALTDLASKKEGDKKRRNAYVHGDSVQSGDKSIAYELTKAVLTDFEIFQSALVAEDYLRFLSKIFASPEAFLLLSGFRPKPESDEPCLKVFESVAESTRMWSLMNPETKYKRGEWQSQSRYREIYDEMISDPQAKNRNDLVFGTLIFYLLSSGVPLESLASHASQIVLELQKMAEVIRSNPLISRIENLSAREGMEYFNNGIKTNADVGDVAYFQQFDKFENEYLFPVAESISISMLADTRIDLYDLMTTSPDQITVYNFFAIKGDLKIDLDFLLKSNPAEQKNIENGEVPSGSHELFSGNLFCIKFDKNSRRGMMVVSTIGEQMAGKYFDLAAIRKSEALSYMFNKDNKKLARDAERLMPLEEDPTLKLPKGSGGKIIGKNLRELLGKLYDDRSGYSIGTQETYAAYLTFNEEKTSSLENKGTVQATDEMIADSLKRVAASVKADKYSRPWWQYITIWLPFVDSLYFRYVDPQFSQEVRSLMFDIVDFFTAGRTVSKAVLVLSRAAIKSAIKKITLRPMLKIGSSTRGEIISEIPNLFCFWVPTGLLPMSVTAKAGSLQKFLKSFNVRFDIPVIIFNANGSIDWLSSADNILLLMNFDAFIIGYQGSFGLGEMNKEQIQEFIEKTSLGNRNSLFGSSDVLDKTRQFFTLLLDNSRNWSVIKYDFFDDKGVSFLGYASVFEMNNGDRYVIDKNTRVDGRLVSKESEWKKAVDARAAGKRVRRQDFDSMTDAKNTDLAVKSPYLEDVSKTISQGAAFYFNGQRFYKTKPGDNLFGLASIFYDEGIQFGVFFGFPLNKKILNGIGLMSSIKPGSVFVVPYVWYSNVNSISNDAVIWSETELPKNYRFGSWVVKGSYRSSNQPLDFDEGSAPKDSNNQLQGGTIFVRDGARFYKVKAGDTWASISKHIYGDERFNHEIKDWEKNTKNKVGSIALKPGDEIAVPYAYKGRDPSFKGPAQPLEFRSPSGDETLADWASRIG